MRDLYSAYVSTFLLLHLCQSLLSSSRSICYFVPSVFFENVSKRETYFKPEGFQYTYVLLFCSCKSHNVQLYTSIKMNVCE